MPAIRVSKDGPYLVSGPLPLSKATTWANADGESVRWEWGPELSTQKNYVLCRRGHSGHKPFCDGTHVKAGFDGHETASRKPYMEQAKMFEGPVLSLSDADALCAFARFCDPNGQGLAARRGDRSRGGHGNFVRQTCDCPSGRLVAWDNATGEPIEPKLQPSIGLIEDPVEKCSGPIWVRGGVQVVSEDGFKYERRNRVTLCRCGASCNKPFCDGSHASTKFKDGL